MAVIDIIVIAVLLVFTIVGMVKGFLNTLLSLFSTFASVAVAVLCAKPVAKFLNGIFNLVGTIGGKLAGSMGGITPFVSASEGGEAISTLTGEQLKEYLANNADGLTFQDRIYRLFIEDSKTFTATAEDYAAADGEVVKYISERIAGVITVVIAAVIIFIALKIAVLLLSKLFDAITKARAIGGLDRTLGMLFGFAKGALLVTLTLGVFYLIANSTIQGWIDNSTVTKFIYKYVTELVEWVVHKYDLPAFITGLFPALS